MAVTKPALAAAVKAIGNAYVYTGDPFTVGGMTPLGAIEGAISFNEDFQDNPLTVEQTGGVAHQNTVTLGNVTITVPIVFADVAQYTKTHPLGLSRGGHSTPQPVVTTSVLIVPDFQHAADGTLSYAIVGTATTPSWTPAAPTHAIMLWRASVMRDAIPFQRDNGGLRTINVTFTGMWFDGTAVREGDKVYTIGGDNIVAAAPTFRL